jgi:hypothetical protein
MVGPANLLHRTGVLSLVAHILAIAATKFAVDAMKDAITRRGHMVSPATDFTQVEQICSGLEVDLAVIGPAIPDRMKKAIGLYLREHCKGLLILEICADGPCFADADFSLKTDRFETLAQSIHSILSDTARQKLG